MSAKSQIAVKLVTQYGVDRIFPANDEAEQFAMIAGTKTLSPSVLVRACRLGFVVKVDGYESTNKIAAMMQKEMPA